MVQVPGHLDGVLPQSVVQLLVIHCIHEAEKQALLGVVIAKSIEQINSHQCESDVQKVLAHSCNHQPVQLNFCVLGSFKIDTFRVNCSKGHKYQTLKSLISVCVGFSNCILDSVL